MFAWVEDQSYGLSIHWLNCYFCARLENCIWLFHLIWSKLDASLLLKARCYVDVWSNRWILICIICTMKSKPPSFHWWSPRRKSMWGTSMICSPSIGTMSFSFDYLYVSFRTFIRSSEWRGLWYVRSSMTGLRWGFLMTEMDWFGGFFFFLNFYRALGVWLRIEWINEGLAEGLMDLNNEDLGVFWAVNCVRADWKLVTRHGSMVTGLWERGKGMGIVIGQNMNDLWLWYQTNAGPRVRGCVEVPKHNTSVEAHVRIHCMCPQRP